MIPAQRQPPAGVPAYVAEGRLQALSIGVQAAKRRSVLTTWWVPSAGIAVIYCSEYLHPAVSDGFASDTARACWA